MMWLSEATVRVLCVHECLRSPWDNYVGVRGHSDGILLSVRGQKRVLCECLWYFVSFRGKSVGIIWVWEPTVKELCDIGHSEGIMRLSETSTVGFWCERHRSELGYFVKVWGHSEGMRWVWEVIWRILYECNQPNENVMSVSECTARILCVNGHRSLLRECQRSQEFFMWVWVATGGYYVSVSGCVRILWLSEATVRFLCECQIECIMRVIGHRGMLCQCQSWSEHITWLSEDTVRVLNECQRSQWVYYMSIRGPTEDSLWMSGAKARILCEYQEAQYGYNIVSECSLSI